MCVPQGCSCLCVGWQEKGQGCSLEVSQRRPHGESGRGRWARAPRPFEIAVGSATSGPRAAVEPGRGSTLVQDRLGFSFSDGEGAWSYSGDPSVLL